MIRPCHAFIHATAAVLSWHVKTGVNLYPFHKQIIIVWSKSCSFYREYHNSWNCGKIIFHTWWRHQMEAFSALLALCAGNSPVLVTSPHKGQWRGALMFSLISARINDWENNREAGDLRRYRAHYVVIVRHHELKNCLWNGSHVTESPASSWTVNVCLANSILSLRI